MAIGTDRGNLLGLQNLDGIHHRRGPLILSRTPPISPGFTAEHAEIAEVFGHATRWIGNELDLIHRYRESGRP